MMAAPAVGRSVYEERLILHPLDGAPIERSTFLSTVRSAILRHPAEPYFPFAYGLYASQTRRDNPLPWLAAALERARVYAPAHLVLARTLASRSPAQARLEDRIAAEPEPQLADFAGEEGSKLVARYEDALELVPSGSGASSALDALSRTISVRLPASADRLH